MITVAGYRIGELLHEGSRTILYDAVRTADHQPVLIKVLRPEQQTAENIEALRHEKELTARLGLDGVVGCCALETTDSGAALIMDHFGGVPLSHLMTRELMGLGAVLALAREVAGVLGELHKQRVIHKNISPASILVNPDTMQVKLTDLGLPPLLRDEHGSPLFGSLLYCSPEQTGRMNRAVDFRTDFYSLGITLYELLTGDVPFRSEDPLQLIHSHIAREPSDPALLKPSLPRSVADIVLKLLAKNAEDRYQSAHSLQKDLDTCLDQLKTPEGIRGFRLGAQDVPPTLTLPNRLYGRERETGLMSEAFERVRLGGNELLLVAGGAGIGKTALINGLQETVLARHAWFLSGKYDQFKQNVPYSSIIFAFKQLINRILSENEETLQLWKDRLLEALTVNGQLIIDVIPEVRLIIGEQPPVSPAGPAESLNRFNRTVQKSVGVVARPEHPLVLFLDDLQWIDPASLNLIRLLLVDSGLKHLLVIGAFRSNEVMPGHPLKLLLDEIAGTGSVTRIDLEPLTEEQATTLICDTLRCPPDRAVSLARIVHYKTGGNPFFMNQMLTMFYEEKLLVYEPGAGWQWNIEAIAHLDVADNIVVLLVGKIGRLAPETRDVLTLASCIGNRFDLATLSIVQDRPTDRILQDLLPALDEGLVIASGDNFLFFHDRIQEAAYSLLSPDEKIAFHYRIGNMVLASAGEEHLRAKVFYIADQLNAGSGHMMDPSERVRLAELNLLAARKAKASSAYASAEKYLTKGSELLPPGSWQTHSVLTKDLFLACAECVYMLGHFERAEQLFAAVLANTAGIREKAEVYKIRVPLALNWGRADEAIELGRKGLALMRFSLPHNPGPGAVMLEFLKIRWHLGRRSAKDLLSLPEMSDPDRLTITETLMNMAPAAYFRSKNLFALIMLTIFTLSLRFGQTKSASVSYAAFGSILAAVLGDYRRGAEFADFAVSLSRRHDLSLQSQCDFVAAALVDHWTSHLNKSSERLVHGYASGMESGNFVFAGYCAGVDTFLRLVRGDRLDEVQDQAEQYLTVLRQIKNEDMIAAVMVFRQAVLALKGCTHRPSALSSDDFDEQAFAEGLRRDKRPFILCLYHVMKLPLHYLFNEHYSALQSAEHLQKNRDHMLGMYYLPHNNFYHSLALTAQYGAAQLREQRSFRRRLRANQKTMQRWAEHCPANFANKYLLVSAEQARLEGRNGEAQELYDRSIRAALENHLLHEAGIANELAGQFHLAQDREKIARGYLSEALLCYRVWGAEAKVRQFEQRHARILQRLPGSAPGIPDVPRPDGTPWSGSQALDLATVLKLSQAISREISLDRLLPDLMKIVIENAGARRGYLLLEQNGRMLIEARGAADRGEYSVLPSAPFEGSGLLAESVVNYTARTREAVVLNNAVQEGQFTQDPAVRMHPVLSILCTPIVSKGRLTGILYLENELASHAFTPERLEVLNALSSQIAISLENARLYDEARRATESLEESEQKFRALAETVRSGIVIYRDERFLYVNPATERITGYTRAEIAMMTFSDVIHPDSLPLVRQRAVDRLAGRPVPAQYEFKIVHKSGETRWVISTAGQIRFGREAALIATLLDITEQKIAEQERLRLFEENERQYRERIEEELRHQREKENILMDIHDGIGGIITNIGLLSQVAQKAASPEDSQKALATISRLAREGNIEVHSLMFSLDGRDHTWRSLAAEMRSNGEKLLSPYAIAFTMNTAMEEAGGQPHELVFLHIFRIYREALNNVIKHARATAVDVDLRVGPDELALVIRDDGVGFHPDSVIGWGRGLSNMKARAAQLGGSIAIASGKGTTVSLMIPFSVRNEQERIGQENRATTGS